MPGPLFPCSSAVALLCALLLASCAATKPAAAPVQNFIRLVVPEADTVEASSPVYRLSAGTAPGNRLALNGRPLRVYPSGAAAGQLDLRMGENAFTLTATDPAGSTVAKSFMVVRVNLRQSTPDSIFRIDSIMTEPAADLWLNEGDRLEVQFKGTPACRASCDLGIPMSEVAPSETGGLRGVYRGAVVVRRGDTLSSRQITFSLTNAAGDTVCAHTKARVAFRGDDFPLVAVTKGDRPALAYGPGEDRLGGAKMSVISSGIRLAINGKQGSQYRVALAPGREAWIAADDVDLLPRGSRPPSALTDRWNVFGDDKYDYVTVGVSQRIPYASTTESDPTRIHVDLFGAASNSNWILQPLTAREIRNVYYTQPSAGVFRITIELRHRQIWGYEIGYGVSGLMIRVRRQPERLKIRGLTVALDAGHGGSNNGAIGSTGAKEKDVTLAVVRALRNILEDRGARVVLTREGDGDVSMPDRLRKALTSGADILVSVHANSVGLTSNPEETHGTATFYKHLCYRPLALAVLNEVLKTGLTMYGNVGSFNFALNSPTEIPNVLVETAFISNPLDEMKLLDTGFQVNIAERIADGVEYFLNSCDD